VPKTQTDLEFPFAVDSRIVEGALVQN
jgi:hypothetical protein